LRRLAVISLRVPETNRAPISAAFLRETLAECNEHRVCFWLLER
jgi:hypothetical protein